MQFAAIFYTGFSIIIHSLRVTAISLDKARLFEQTVDNILNNLKPHKLIVMGIKIFMLIGKYLVILFLAFISIDSLQ